MYPGQCAETCEMQSAEVLPEDNLSVVSFGPERNV
jgi:hypothetical protein